MIGAGVYTYTDKTIEKVSPLDPKPATQTVPIDAAIQPDLPHASAQAQKQLPQLPNTDVVGNVDVSVSEPQAGGKEVDFNTRLNDIEQAIVQQSQKIDAVLNNVTELVALSKSPASSSDITTSTAKPVAKKQRRNKQTNVAGSGSTKAASQTKSIGEPTPELLAVDSWSGETSVVVRQGAQVQFLSEGDRAGNYVLQGADKQGQRVTFMDQSGNRAMKERVDQ